MALGRLNWTVHNDMVGAAPGEMLMLCALTLAAAQGLPLYERVSVSVVAACRGRHAQLEGNLPSWLRVEGVHEAVIVDWSSSPQLRPALECALRVAPAGAARPRVVLARVEAEDGWVLSRAYNVGFRLATGALILKVDCDVRLAPSFALAHLPVLAQRAFVAGDWRRAASANELHLNGLFAAWADDLVCAGGFDERIATYGWDDSDLFARLAQVSGAQRRALNMSLAEHVPHTSAARLAHSAGLHPAAGAGAAGGQHGDGSSVGSTPLAEIVGASGPSELELSASEMAVVAIQQNRIALERLPTVWRGRACDRQRLSTRPTRPGDGRLPLGTGTSREPCGESVLRSHFEAWCGSEYEWLRCDCAPVDGGGARPGAALQQLTLVELRATRATPSLRDAVGDAAWLAAWYEAMAQELPGLRRARLVLQTLTAMRSSG